MRKSLPILPTLLIMVSLLLPVCAQTQQPALATSSAPPSFADALHLSRTGKLESALTEYNSLLAAGTQPAVAYVGLSRVYLKLDRTKEAYAAAAKAVELQPDQPDTHVALGEVYFRQGKLPEAEKEFVPLVKDQTDDARAYLGMARISEAASFHKQAKDLIENAYELDPDDPEIRFERYRFQGRKTAVKILQDPSRAQTEESSPAQTSKTQTDPLEMNYLDIMARDASICSVVPNTKSSQVALHPLFEPASVIRGFGLEVKVDGAPSKLLLDTCASGILVNRKVAEKANLKKVGGSTITGIGDKNPMEGYHTVAESVRIGDLEFKNCIVEVSEKTSIIGEDGLIGADVFANFLVDIDFPNQKLRLSELPPYPDEQAKPSNQGELQFHNRYIAPEMKTYTQVYQFRRQLLIQTKINNSAAKLFLLDTGATINAISPAAAKEVTYVSENPDMEVKGISGKVKTVFSGDSVTMTFGNIQQQNLEITGFDTTAISNSMGTEVSGILGFSTLKLLDFKIDYRDGLVKFTFDSSRIH
jgi:Flp pilus assembly protein TadD/predicted aspartyl protease